jgi:hypothetical protein
MNTEEDSSSIWPTAVGIFRFADKKIEDETSAVVEQSGSVVEYTGSSKTSVKKIQISKSFRVWTYFINVC